MFEEVKNMKTEPGIAVQGREISSNNPHLEPNPKVANAEGPTTTKTSKTRAYFYSLNSHCKLGQKVIQPPKSWGGNTSKTRAYAEVPTTRHITLGEIRAC